MHIVETLRGRASHSFRLQLNLAALWNILTKYDKVPEAINFRALELKDATSICQRDMASFNSITLSWFFGAGAENL